MNFWLDAQLSPALASFAEALALLAAGEPLVEISEGKRRFG
jgi:hypothetical protein